MKILKMSIVLIICLNYSNTFISKGASKKFDHVFIKSCHTQIGCKEKLDEIFRLTINKKQVVIHSSQYCHDICNLINSEKRCLDANTKIDLIISLILFQNRHTKTVAQYFGLHQLKNTNSMFLMLFAPLKEIGNDSLLAIQTNDYFLNKLDSIHLDFVLKTQSLIKNSISFEYLNDDYKELILASFNKKWFFDKYDKYFLNL